MVNPQISVVAVGRNDNYGGDFKARLQSFITWTFIQLTQQNIQSELIFVNYNPLDAEPPIESFITWPVSNDWVTLRIITVPRQIHEETVSKFDLKDVPVLEYVAKNVGIRRAKGKFILSMNPDILIDEEIVKQFSQLSEQNYYRANRIDFAKAEQLLPDGPLYEQLRENATTIWLKGSHFNIRGFSYLKYRWYRLLNRTANAWKRNTIHLEWVLKRINITTYYHNWQFKYHSNACGDFMLMSRDSWRILKGHKESSFIALHVDALMVIQAVMHGLKEHVFHHPIYHKQHKRRFDAHNRLTEDQVKVYHQYNEDVEFMLNSGNHIIFNQDSWGLGSSALPEQYF
jgi:hypothetical protein